MGAFFTNYQVRSNSAEEVIRVVAAAAKGRAYVSPPKNGWVTVYDEASDDQDENELRRLAMVISKELSTCVFAFLDHDSDILLYFLYEQGQAVDEYNSSPDYFQQANERTRQRCRGNAEALLKHCVSGTRLEDLEKIIHQPEEHPFAEEILEELAPLLGMDQARLHLGFNYFEGEAAESLEDADSFRLVGKGVTEAEQVASREKIKKAAAAAGPRGAVTPQPKDIYCIGIGMIASTREDSDMMRTAIAAMQQQGMDGQAALARMQKTTDHMVVKMLKPCATPDWPTAETLVAAADKGPAELARLVATTTPQLLGQITVQVAGPCNLAWLRAFVEAGGNVNAVTEHGVTPLFSAVGHRKTESVAYLLEAGADVNVKGPDGRTPLQLALAMKHMDIVELLHQHGAKQ